MDLLHQVDTANEIKKPNNFDENDIVKNESVQFAVESPSIKEEKEDEEGKYENLSKWINCSGCGKTIQTFQKARHEIACLKRKFWSCDYCDYVSWHSNLRRHMKKHTKAELKCDQCDYKTKNKSFYDNHLKQHALAHKIKKQRTLHQCPTCTFKDKDRKRLATHKEICQRYEPVHIMIF